MKAFAQRIIALTERPLVRNIVLVAGGSATAHIITLVFSPLITRLYGPEAYGNMSVFMSIAAVASAVAALSYPIAIVLPKPDTDALGLARLSIGIGITSSIFVAITLFLFGPALLIALNLHKLEPLIYLLPLYMLATVMSAVAGQWLMRRQAFALLSRIPVWQALAINTAKLGFGQFSPTAIVLVLTNTFGALFGAALMALGSRKLRIAERINDPTTENGHSARTLATRYRDFPLLRTPQVLLNAVSQSLPVLLLATFFGASSVGFYALAFGVVAVPVTLIGNSVMQVFYPRIAEAIHRGEDAKALIVSATWGMALSSVIPFALVILGGPLLFAVLFGVEWRMAGVYAQWLSIWLFFQCINRPAVAAIPALRLQRSLLTYELLSSSSKAIALYAGYHIFASDVAAIAIFSVFGALAYAGLIAWVIRRSAYFHSHIH